MIKDKKDIRALINRYLTNNEGIKALGFISYHTFDKELIESDYESLNVFFRENFDLNHRVINYQDLLKDASKNTWLKINDVYDLELLDELIALAIAANVLTENLLFRYEEAFGQLDLIALINENPEDLQHYSEQEYLKVMNRRVLPTFKLLVSEYTLSCYEKDQLKNDYSDEIKRELLLSWWDQGMEGHDYSETRETFLEYLSTTNLMGIIQFIYQLYSKNDTAM